MPLIMFTKEMVDNTVILTKTKTCSRCKQVLPIEQFYKHNTTKDGLFPYCLKCHAAASRKRYASNPGKYREHAKRWYTEHPFEYWRSVSFRHARGRAAEKGIPFSITREEWPERVDVCPVFGMPLSYSSGKYSQASATIDRLIPELGYVPGNVAIISMKANSMKSDLLPAEIIQRAAEQPANEDQQALARWVQTRTKELDFLVMLAKWLETSEQDAA